MYRKGVDSVFWTCHGLGMDGGDADNQETTMKTMTIEILAPDLHPDLGSCLDAEDRRCDDGTGQIYISWPCPESDDEGSCTTRDGDPCDCDAYDSTVQEDAIRAALTVMGFRGLREVDSGISERCIGRNGRAIDAHSYWTWSYTAHE